MATDVIGLKVAGPRLRWAVGLLHNAAVTVQDVRRAPDGSYTLVIDADDQEEALQALGAMAEGRRSRSKRRSRTDSEITFLLFLSVLSGLVIYAPVHFLWLAPALGVATGNPLLLLAGLGIVGGLWVMWLRGWAR